MKTSEFSDRLEKDVEDYLRLVTQQPQTSKGEVARQKLVRWYEEQILSHNKLCS